VGNHASNTTAPVNPTGAALLPKGRAMSTQVPVSDLNEGDTVVFPAKFGPWSRAQVQIVTVDHDSNLGRTRLTWTTASDFAGAGHFFPDFEFSLPERPTE